MHLRTLLSLAAAIQVILADYLYFDATDGNGNALPSYSPGRPPAVPLAVRSPYLNAWSTTANNSTLNSGPVSFWSGAPLGWEGMVAVDGITYEYLGTGAQALQRMPSTFKSASPLTVTYNSQYSNFTFQAGPVEIIASFFSPVTPKDICRSSIPLSYLTTSVRSTDGEPHSIQLYSDVNAAWIAFDGGSTIIWDLVRGAAGSLNSTQGSGDGVSTMTYPTCKFCNGTKSNPAVNKTGSTLFSWVFYQATHYPFAEQGDFPEWGNFSYSTSPMGAENFTFQSGYSVDMWYTFVTQHALSDIVDSNYRGSANREPVFAFAHDMGLVTEATVRYTIGSIQTPTVRYLYYGGVSKLLPWWQKCYGDMYSMIRFHWGDFQMAQQLAAGFEASLKSDIGNALGRGEAGVCNNQTASPGGPASSTSQAPFYPNGSTSCFASASAQTSQPYIFDSNTGYGYLDPTTFEGVPVSGVSEAEAYYAIVALSARQVMGAYVYAVPPAMGTCGKQSTDLDEPLMFQKEISSDDNVNTVDVLYPATPFFLWANPEMLKYTLQPLYEIQEGDFYPNGYCMHDIGSSFPNATGHVEGTDEYMPVEESGNFILMSYAYYKFSGNTAWLRSHYQILKQFAQYLVDFSLVPAAQLSTDDFAGTLTNQTNLAIKGIIGLQAMGQIARIAGAAADAAYFSTTANQYYAQWKFFAIDPSHKHTLLAYQWRSSWGLLYNVYMDKVLDLGIIEQSVYEMQSEWYQQVSQVYGVPLDNRHHYTKSDWMMWTAATCSPETRRLLITSLAYWLNYSTTEGPFADLYEVISTGYYPQVPNDIRFKARPVVGGHFALLALESAGHVGHVAGHNTAYNTATANLGDNGVGTADGGSEEAWRGSTSFTPASSFVTSATLDWTTTTQTVVVVKTRTFSSSPRTTTDTVEDVDADADDADVWLTWSNWW